MASTEEKTKAAEERVMAILLQYPADIPLIRLKLLPEYFKTIPYRNIFETVCDYLEKMGIAPLPSILKELLAKKHPEQADPYGVLVEKLTHTSLEVGEHQHVGHHIGVLKAYYTERVIKDRIGTILGNLDKENIQAAQEVFSKGLPQTGDDFLVGHIEPDAKQHLIDQEYRHNHPELFAGIRMGFDNIDHFTGGHYRKELGVVVGGTGVGKSLVLGQVALNVARQGKKVVLVTIENDKQSYMNRIYSNIAQVPFYDFKNNLVTTPNLVERFFTGMEKLPKNFFLDVVEFPAGCSPNDIWFYLRHLPHEINYLVVDQISNMMPNDPDKYKPDSWQSYGHIALEMKRMIGNIYNGKGIPCLTAMQASGGTGEKRELSTDDIAMSKQIIRHAHFALYITKVEDTHTMGASKYRDARIEPFTVFPTFKYWQLGERPHEEEHASAPAGAIPPSPIIVVDEVPRKDPEESQPNASITEQPFTEEKTDDPALAREELDSLTKPPDSEPEEL